MGFWDIFKRKKQKPEAVQNTVQSDSPSQEGPSDEGIKVKDVHALDEVLGISYEERLKMRDEARKEIEAKEKAFDDVIETLHQTCCQMASDDFAWGKTVMIGQVDWKAKFNVRSTIYSLLGSASNEFNKYGFAIICIVTNDGIVWLTKGDNLDAAKQNVTSNLDNCITVIHQLRDGIGKENYILYDGKKSKNMYEVFATPEEQAEYEASKRAEEEQKIEIDFERLLSLPQITPQPLSLTEILYLRSLEKCPAESSRVAGYWVRTHELDAQKSLEKFFSYGYLQFADVSCAVSKCTINDLKAILSTHQLPVSGKKAVLVDRVLKNISNEELSQHITSQYLDLTEKGKELTAANEHLHYFDVHNKYLDIAIEEADAVHREHPDFSNLQIIETVMSQRQKKYKKQKEYEKYRECLFALSCAYEDAGNTEAQIKYLLQSCFMDLFGYSDDGMIDPAHGHLFESDSLRHLYKDDYERLHQDFINAIQELDIPKNQGMDQEAWDKLLDALKE